MEIDMDLKSLGLPANQEPIKMRMINPSPILGYEIETGELAGRYLSPIVTLEKALLFERLSGLRFMSFGWWETTAGTSAWLFILVKEKKRDLDWESFLQIVELTEVFVLINRPDMEETDADVPLEDEAKEIANEVSDLLSNDSTGGELR